MRPFLSVVLLSAALGVACGGDPTTGDSADSGAAPCTDPVTWYADADADGFGVDGVSQEACEPPLGFTDLGGDCDDTDDTVHPAATETCDGVDSDCNGLVDDGDEPQEWYLDHDVDGYGEPSSVVVRCERPTAHVQNGRDCDDDDPTVFPGATETCDGVDQDCDGTVDDDPVDGELYYLDDDGDGFGVQVFPTLACARPDGYAAAFGDCDDTDAGAHPDADELCGGGDEDCDGAVDERGAADETTCYWDGDSDGFGDPFLSQTSCEQPPGTVDNGADCDDTDSAFSPSATELCNGRDDDCDGSTDGTDAADADTWYVDSDGDGHGDPSLTTGACDQPSGYAGTADDCDDSDASVSPSASEVCGDGVDNDCSGDAVGCSRSGRWDGAYADLKLLGASANDYAGGAVDAAGDLDGDGVSDLVVGAWYESTAASSAGAAHVVLGPARDGSLGAADGLWTAEQSGESMARKVAGAGDVDGDGLDDLLVGSQYSSLTANSSGTAYLVSGPATGTHSLGTATAAFYGAASADYLAHGLDGAGDLDGDGYADLVLGAPYEDSAGTSAGAVFVINGPVATADVASAVATGQILGADSGDALGSAVAGAGDLDGDGLDDLVLGAFTATDSAGSQSGAAYVFLGPVTGVVSASAADATRTGQTHGDNLGYAVASPGDTDGDGYRDLLLGAPYEDSAGTSGGAAYLVLGPVGGSASISGADAVILADSSGDYLGFGVAGGDLDQDGLDDVVVSAPYEASVGSAGGAAYAFLAPLSGTLTATDADLSLLGERGSSYLGYALGTPADVDGDGVPELLVGALGESESGSFAGAVYGLSLLNP